jgi:DNA primase
MGKSMNVIDFVMQYEGINFLDAIKRLASIGNVAGVEIEVNNEYRYRKMLREIDLDLIQLNDFLKSGLVDKDMVLLEMRAKENEKNAIVNMMERSGKYWD